MSEPTSDGDKGGLSFKRLLPLLILAAGLVAFFAAGGQRYLSFEVLSEHRVALTEYVAANAVLAVVIFLVA